MSATISVESTATSHYQRRRHSRNKKSDQRDTFLSLSDDAVADAVGAVRCSTPTPSTTSDNGDMRSRDLFSELVLTPLRVISFVLSLCIVEFQQRQWRWRQHASADQRSKRWWFSNPEPYQEASGSTWHQNHSWSRRGTTKLQLSESLEISGRVGVALAAWSMLGLLACVYAIRQAYSWMFCC